MSNPITYGPITEISRMEVAMPFGAPFSEDIPRWSLGSEKLYSRKTSNGLELVFAIDYADSRSLGYICLNPIADDLQITVCELVTGIRDQWERNCQPALLVMYPEIVRCVPTGKEEKMWFLRIVGVNFADIFGSNVVLSAVKIETLSKYAALGDITHLCLGDEK